MKRFIQTSFIVVCISLLITVGYVSASPNQELSLAAIADRLRSHAERLDILEEQEARITELEEQVAILTAPTPIPSPYKAWREITSDTVEVDAWRHSGVSAERGYLIIECRGSDDSAWFNAELVWKDVAYLGHWDEVAVNLDFHPQDEADTTWNMYPVPGERGFRIKPDTSVARESLLRVLLTHYDLQIEVALKVIDITEDAAESVDPDDSSTVVYTFNAVQFNPETVREAYEYLKSQTLCELGNL